MNDVDLRTALVSLAELYISINSSKVEQSPSLSFFTKRVIEDDHEEKEQLHELEVL